MILLTLLAAALGAAFGLSLFFPTRVGDVSTPSCETNRRMILMAQAVPSAEQLPCIRSLPLGWSLSGATIVRGRATFVLEVAGGGGSVEQLGEGTGSPAIDVSLSSTCLAKDEVSTIQVIEVKGGCVAYRSSLPAGLEPVPSFETDGGLSFVPRVELVRFVENEEDLILCGAGAPCD